jgi:tRNA splicing ligase
MGEDHHRAGCRAWMWWVTCDAVDTPALISITFTGKTAVGVALSHLFGWGHTQSDDVKSKKSGPAFTRNVVDLLKNHEVVYADRFVTLLASLRTRMFR